MAPAFTKRITAEEFNKEAEDETKKALAELMEQNKDFFQNKPLFSPAKVRARYSCGMALTL